MPKVSRIRPPTRREFGIRRRDLAASDLSATFIISLSRTSIISPVSSTFPKFPSTTRDELSTSYWYVFTVLGRGGPAETQDRRVVDLALDESTSLPGFGGRSRSRPRWDVDRCPRWTSSPSKTLLDVVQDPQDPKTSSFKTSLQDLKTPETSVGDCSRRLKTATLKTLKTSIPHGSRPRWEGVQDPQDLQDFKLQHIKIQDLKTSVGYCARRLKTSILQDRSSPQDLKTTQHLNTSRPLTTSTLTTSTLQDHSRPQHFKTLKTLEDLNERLLNTTRDFNTSRPLKLQDRSSPQYLKNPNTPREGPENAPTTVVDSHLGDSRPRWDGVQDLAGRRSRPQDTRSRLLYFKTAQVLKTSTYSSRPLKTSILQDRSRHQDINTRSRPQDFNTLKTHLNISRQGPEDAAKTVGSSCSGRLNTLPRPCARPAVP
ncbi:hypothetical protein C8R44DRAFT_870217 [Mycena epipterygia]|nr:hypothetical protein C8R44DRAFT_870217 [Mycena epipterygia]